MKKTFPVTGMMCAGCAVSVEEILQKVEGVTHTQVSYATQKAEVTFDETKVSPFQLKTILEEAGFGLEVEEISHLELQHKRKRAVDKLKWDFIGGLLLGLPVCIIAMCHLDFPYSDYVQAVLSLVVLVVFGRRFFLGAVKALKNRSANMDTLVALSTGVAYLYSLSQLWFFNFWDLHKQELYFEAVVMIISFISLGKYLEENAKSKANEAINSLMGLTPKSVWVKKEGQWQEMLLKEVRRGDIIQVKAGDKIPIDGEIIFGETFIDEQMLTGEAMPCPKKVGDKVFAGTMNGLYPFEIQALTSSDQTLLASIIKSVEKAQQSKPPVQYLVDKITKYFVPVVVGLSVLTLLVWWVCFDDFLQGFKSFVTMLVIACPCALGLATPMALIVAIGRAAKSGVFVKDATSLELAKDITTVVLDKTGTITKGTPEVKQYFFADEVDIKYLVSVEEYSQHPLAKSVVGYWRAEKFSEEVKVEDFEELVGEGVKAIVLNRKVEVASAEYFRGKGVKISEEIQQKINEFQQELTLILLSLEDEIVGVVGLSDSVKPTSPKAIEKLKDLGIEVYMLTGDGLFQADLVAQQVGIKHIVHSVKPAEKQDFIRELQLKGKKVAMVGDGINDSSALALADVSVAMGKGSDIAMQSAQITLMHSDLQGLILAIKLSKSTYKTIKENLFWAFFYNLIALLVATGMFSRFGIEISPMIAAFAMVFSSISVVANSLLLRKFTI